MISIIRLFLVCVLFLSYSFARYKKKTFYTQSENGNLSSFDVKNTLPLRGIMCLLIIIGHIAEPMANCGVISWDFAGRYLNWGPSVVSMFLFLTGYGLSISFICKGEKYLNDFFSHRLSKLLPPVIAISLIYVIVRLYILKTNIDNIFSLSKGILPIGASWFIFFTILFYFIFYLSYKSIKGKGVLVALWAFVIIYTLLINNIGWGEHWMISTPALALGCTYAHYEQEIKKWVAKQPLLAFIAICCLLSISCCCYYIPDFWGINSRYTINWIAPLSIVLSIYLNGFCQHRALLFLGSISYEVFLWHQLYIYIIPCTQKNWPLFIVSVYVLTIITACLTKRLFDKVQSTPVTK